MRHFVRCRAAVVTILAAAALPARADTYTVTTTANAGAGSLRQAILDANAKQVTAGTACAPHSIVFAIPGVGPHTIQPLSALPAFQIGITLDGYTQPGSAQSTALQGSNAVLEIELDGSRAGNVDGLVVGRPSLGVCGGGGSVIRGLVVNRFAGSAIVIGVDVCPMGEFCPVGGVRITGNFIGTDPDGAMAAGNGVGLGVAAIRIGDVSTFNVIGDQIASEGGPTTPSSSTLNVISGNGGDAVSIGSPMPSVQSASNTVRNNIIGLDASGTVMLGNAGHGVAALSGSSATRIEDNLISGNGGDGVLITDNPFGGATVLRNGIGIGFGDLALGNAGNGVHVTGSARGISVGRRFGFAGLGMPSIAHNGGAGLLVEDTAIVDVIAGAFGANVGLGIDLAPPGVNADDDLDPDGGPNELLNAPVLTGAQRDPGTGATAITGTLNSTPNSNIEVHFYGSTDCDPSGFGEGFAHLTDGLIPLTVTAPTDAQGNAAFMRTTVGLPSGHQVTALSRRFSTTAGTPALEVSEFSNCQAVVEPSFLIFKDGFESVQ